MAYQRKISKKQLGDGVDLLYSRIDSFLDISLGKDYSVEEIVEFSTGTKMTETIRKAVALYCFSGLGVKEEDISLTLTSFLKPSESKEKLSLISKSDAINQVNFELRPYLSLVDKPFPAKGMSPDNPEAKTRVALAFNGEPGKLIGVFTLEGLKAYTIGIGLHVAANKSEASINNMDFTALLNVWKQFAPKFYGTEDSVHLIRLSHSAFSDLCNEKPCILDEPIPVKVSLLTPAHIYAMINA